MAECARSRAVDLGGRNLGGSAYLLSHDPVSSIDVDSPACTDSIVYSIYAIFPSSSFIALHLHLLGINMCGDTNRSTFGGTIALLSPQESRISSNPSSLSSSPDSIVSASSTSTLSSYSLFFRDAETKDRNTKAIFQIDDEETFETLRGCGTVSMRIE